MKLLLWLNAFYWSMSSIGNADFIYHDFNQTLGLNFNGDAFTTGCNINNTYVTVEEENRNLEVNEHNLVSIGKESDQQIKQTVITNDKDSTNDTNIIDLEAQFGHRDTYALSFKKGCKRRLRLTPSSPSKVGSVFYEKRVHVVSY